MPSYDYFTVDVFTQRRFGGNPLAVFPTAEGIDDATMQALAAELNYSETTFVLPPANSVSTARVRIFNRTSEMPFAGHPNVGTAFVLARHGFVRGAMLRFEELAGMVEVRVMEADGVILGAEIDAPLPLTILEDLPVQDIAACLSLATDEIVIAEHPPIRATTGVDFVLVGVTPHGVAQAFPDLKAYRMLERQWPSFGGRLSILLYSVEAHNVRARMFAPLAGTWEDPATGSANATLAALRLHLSGDERLSYEAVQGVEMGRESRLSVRSWRTPDGVRASVGGMCASVFRGRIEL